MESIVSCTLPSHIHQALNQRRESFQPAEAHGLKIIPIPNVEASDGRQAFQNHTNTIVADCNSHVHAPSCRKGAIGRKLCRFAMPQAVEEETTIKELEEGDTDIPRVKSEITDPPSRSGSFLDEPLPPKSIFELFTLP